MFFVVSEFLNDVERVIVMFALQ